jgi:hypothetical protein
MTMPAAAHPKNRGAAANARRVGQRSEGTTEAPRTDGIPLNEHLLQVGEVHSRTGRSAASRPGRGGLALGGGSLGHAGLISRGRDRFKQRPHESAKAIIRLSV